MNSELVALPPISQCTESKQTMEQALCLLLEPSESLSSLVLELSELRFKCNVDSYSYLLTLAFTEIIARWSRSRKAEFISGHPRIGATKSLSAMSSQEQASSQTAPSDLEVIERLSRLNDLYERRYPGLRYIIFVDGRSRLEVADVLEGFLGAQGVRLDSTHSVSSLAPDCAEWDEELTRAVGDVERIARSRLLKMGVE